MAAGLAGIVGDANVLGDHEVVAGYVVDWTGRFRGHTPVVVRPGNTEEVGEVVSWCAANSVAVVAQGGNTGLVGGSVPLDGEVVLSLLRLNDLGDVDVAAAQVTTGAGATLAAVQDHAGEAGFEFAVDLAARGTATIGGMVATNAGGNRVLRYGPMRASVAGVEAVLGDGSIVSHLGGLVKDNTGYDLAGLLCGSEGTLGIVTRVRLRLVPIAAFRTAALLGLESVDHALECVVAARARATGLEAAEVFFAEGLDLVCGHLQMAPPFAERHPVYLLLECAAAADPTDGLAESLAPVAADVAATAVADTASRREELWRYRDAHTEAINAAGVPHKLDVTVPAGALARFCDEVRETVASVAPGARTFLFGHLGDGNLHVNVVGSGAGPDQGVDDGVDQAVDEAVLDLVAARGGSISAEHGIGTAKSRFLHLARSPSEIAAFRRIKSALDPAGILNPNVLLPRR